MSRYFVIDFKKINTQEAYKNIVAGHNNRNRNYPNRLNINTSKSKNNIVLSPLKYKSASELIDTANQIIKEENIKIKERNKNIKDEEQKEKLRRGLKKGSAFAFNIVVDCSVIPDWQESNYIEYLKEAEKWLRNRFEGQEIISSVVHMDESKPHLHITFSYFNTNLKKWNQREMRDKKLTDLNLILKDFEREVGQKYGLKKGDNQGLKKELSKEVKKIFNSKIETYKVKKGLISTQEIKAISVKNISKCLTIYNNKIVKKIPQIGEIERLKEELLKTKKEVEKVKEIAKKETEEKYKKHIAELTKALNNNLEQELIQELNKQHKHIQELNKKLKEKENIINKKNIQIQELQAKIKELMPEKKDKNYSIGGIGL
jgi:hypothetical protein